jgi:hypothetical protein
MNTHKSRKDKKEKCKHEWDRPEPYCNHATEIRADDTTRFVDEWFYPVCKKCGKLKY